MCDLQIQERKKFIQLPDDRRLPNDSLTKQANNSSNMQPWGLNIMTEAEHPFSPMGGLVRVRREYWNAVARRHGKFYASSNLALRERRGKELLFAPVAVAPGNIVTFIWPAEPLNVDWVEIVGMCD